jgi:hypothetical protein
MGIKAESVPSPPALQRCSIFSGRRPFPRVARAFDSAAWASSGALPQPCHAQNRGGGAKLPRDGMCSRALAPPGPRQASMTAHERAAPSVPCGQAPHVDRRLQLASFTRCFAALRHGATRNPRSRKPLPNERPSPSRIAMWSWHRLNFAEAVGASAPCRPRLRSRLAGR